MSWTRTKTMVATVVVAATGLAVSVSPVAAAGSTQPALVIPVSDPFYSAPSGLSSLRPGAIVRSRPVSLAAFGALPQKVRAWQVLYRTTDYQGHPSATVTTVVRPVSGTPRGLLSYQIPEDASTTRCAPSYLLRQGTITFEPSNQMEILLIDAMVAQGFAVSLPDYEGIHSQFGAPRQPGYAILDGVRAAERFSPLGVVGARTSVGLWGYSGGSLATGWAAQLQPSYAREIRVRGVAVGGYLTSLSKALLLNNGNFAAGLIPSTLPGLARTAPGVAAALRNYTTPAGKALLADAATKCLSENVLDHLFMNMDHSYLTIPMTKFVALPSVSADLHKADLGGTAPTAPMFVYHSVPDEIVPITGTDAIVPSYCARGTSVTYTRDLVSDHITLEEFGAPAALSWLSQRLTGDSVPRGCATRTVATMLLTPGSLTATAQLLLADARGLTGGPV